MRQNVGDKIKKRWQNWLLCLRKEVITQPSVLFYEMRDPGWHHAGFPHRLADYGINVVQLAFVRQCRRMVPNVRKLQSQLFSSFRGVGFEKPKTVLFRVIIVKILADYSINVVQLAFVRQCRRMVPTVRKLRSQLFSSFGGVGFEKPKIVFFSTIQILVAPRDPQITL